MDTVIEFTQQLKSYIEEVAVGVNHSGSIWLYIAMTCLLVSKLYVKN